MLDIDSPRWQELKHAYGNASDIPLLLRQLEANPNTSVREIDNSQRVWESLYSTLCHQGSVYEASYAAVPHLVRIAALASDPLSFDYFCLPAFIEQGRFASDADRMLPDLEEAYLSAIQHLPSLLPRIALAKWDEPTTRYMVSALAALKGHSELANVIEMMEPEEIESYYEYKDNE